MRFASLCSLVLASALLAACGSPGGQGSFGWPDGAVDVGGLDAADVASGDGEPGDDVATAEDAVPGDAGPDAAPDVCVPKTCTGAGAECGFVPDGCGGTLPCGGCEGDATCQAGACVDPACADACSPLWGTACSGSTGFRVCAPASATGAADGCPATGPFVSCSAGNTCASGGCSGGCALPELLVVLDRSSSMKGNLWGFTEPTLAAWLTAIAPGAQVGLRTFPSSEDGCAPGPTLAPDFDQAGALVAGLLPPASSASTPIGQALDGLTAVLGDPAQGEAVVLITDGSETCGDPSAALASVAALRARGTAVYVVGLGFGYDELLLNDLAALGGTGAPRLAKDGPALLAALRGIYDDVTGCQSPKGAGLATCDLGTCLTACAEGHHLCGDTCAADDDAKACGAACQVCPTDPNGTATCVAGACELVCGDGFHLCGGACVADDDTDHCGTSCAPCLDPANGAPTCDGVACGITCDAGHHACGSQCLLNTSPDSCGASCTPCPGVTNGKATCSGGQCGLACDSGFHLCGGQCVADSSITACGAACVVCPTSANGTTTCEAGQCVQKCAAGFHLCGTTCQPDSSITACGPSCVTCPTVQDATTSCVAGGCQVKCKAGFHYCEGQCVANDELLVTSHTYGVAAESEVVRAAGPSAAGGVYLGGYWAESSEWSWDGVAWLAEVDAAGGLVWSKTVAPTTLATQSLVVAVGPHPDGGLVAVAQAGSPSSAKGLQRIRVDAAGKVTANVTSDAVLTYVNDAVVLADGGFAVTTFGTAAKPVRVVRFDAAGKVVWTRDLAFTMNNSYGVVGALSGGGVGVTATGDGVYQYVGIDAQGTVGPLVGGTGYVRALGGHPAGGAVLVGSAGNQGQAMIARVDGSNAVAWSKTTTWLGDWESVHVRADGTMLLGGTIHDGAAGYDSLVVRLADASGEMAWERSWYNESGLSIYEVWGGYVVPLPGTGFALAGTVGSSGSSGSNKAAVLRRVPCGP